MTWPDNHEPNTSGVLKTCLDYLKAGIQQVLSAVGTSATANGIPQADNTGKIASGWLPTNIMVMPASGVAQQVLVKTADGIGWAWIGDLPTQQPSA